MPDSAAVAQLVERVLGKDEVTGSNPASPIALSAGVERRVTMRLAGSHEPRRLCRRVE